MLRVTGGEGCFSLLNNGTTSADAAWGNGAPEFAFNGILMFGILMSNLLILNEGAKGKWTIMIPVLIGFVVGTVVLWTMWVENGSSEAPKFVLPIVTLAYAAAYYLLMGEDEVNEGMSDFKIGLGVKDPVTIVALLFVIATGAFYVVRQLVNPESVIEAVNGVTGADGLGAPAKVTGCVYGRPAPAVRAVGDPHFDPGRRRHVARGAPTAVCVHGRGGGELLRFCFRTRSRIHRTEPNGRHGWTDDPADFPDRLPASA